MSSTNEAFSRVKIDVQLRDQGWEVENPDAIRYARQLKVPFIFLANGEEIRVWEWEKEAYPRAI